MHRVDRKAGEVPTFVMCGVTIPRRVKHQVAQRVGAVVSEVEKERPLLVLFDELDALPRPEVGRVSRFLTHLAVFDDGLVVELMRVALGLGDPERESLGWIEVVAQVPLAAEPAHVTGVAEHFAQRREILERVVRARSHHEHRAQRRVDTVLRRHHARQERGSRRRTDRIAAERPREADALGGEPVDVRRADVRIAVATERPGALVVRENENDIRRAGGRRD